jgi:predicted CoA-binding protein
MKEKHEQSTKVPDSTLRNILRKANVIAMVGLRDDASHPSYEVASYLQANGYHIVPINPKETVVLGEQAYPDVPSVPFDVDVVDIFRRPEAVGPHVEEAITRGVPTVWMQLGIRNDEAAQRAQEAGIQVVMDHCMKQEHKRLIQPAQS